jgi:hypothetical protein
MMYDKIQFEVLHRANCQIVTALSMNKAHTALMMEAASTSETLANFRKINKAQQPRRQPSSCCTKVQLNR